MPANQTGVYWFGLVIPAAHEIGLLPERLPDDRARARLELTSTLDRFARVYGDNKLSGRLRDSRHRHLAVALDVHAVAHRLIEPGHFFSRWMQSAADADVGEMLRNLRRISECLPPVYVGLAHEQSLADRLRDHLEGRSNLLGHLKRTDLHWQDLYYRCVAIESLDKASYRVLGKDTTVFVPPRVFESLGVLHGFVAQR